jgi:hypothetical protein
MNSINCPTCGLAASHGDAWCRRCGNRLPVNAPQLVNPGVNQPNYGGSEAAGFSAIPDYGLPRGPHGQPFPAGALQPGEGIWRDGEKSLVMLKSARLPDNCIKCGAPANGTHLRKRLSWHHPALALLVLLNVLIYLIVALIVRKTVKMDIPLCEEHLRKHRTAVLVTWLVFLFAIGFFVLAIAAESGGSAFFGLILLLASAILAIFWAKIVNVRKIDDHYIWLTRLDDSFLSLFPFLNR